MEENNPIEQNLNTTPPVSPVVQTSPQTPPISGSKSKLPILIIGIILFLLIISSVMFFTLTMNKTKSVSPSQKTTIKKNLNPGTGNLYEDIKVRLKEELK